MFINDDWFPYPLDDGERDKSRGTPWGEDHRNIRAPYFLGSRRDIRELNYSTLKNLGGAFLFRLRLRNYKSRVLFPLSISPQVIINLLLHLILSAQYSRFDIPISSSKISTWESFAQKMDGQSSPP